MKRENKFCRNFGLIVSLLFLLSSVTEAQLSNYISNVRVGDAKEKSPIQIITELINADNINELMLAYRTFGNTEYTRIQMEIIGNNASATIPADVVLPPSIEYYLMISLKTGSPETYPLGVEEGTAPLQIIVSALSQKDQEVLVLSPTDGEVQSEDEALISISLLKAPDNVDISKTKIYLNDVDLTSAALFAGDMIIIGSDGIPPGFSSAKYLKVEVYDSTGNLYHSVTRTFQVVSRQLAAKLESAWKYGMNLKGEARNESFDSKSTLYKNLLADMYTTSGDWRIGGNVYVTSEENEKTQPYNRYTASIKGGDWLALHAGDAYPRFPSLIMDGKRIRGFSGEVNLGFFNIQAAYGEIERKIEGTLLETYTKDNVPLGSNIISLQPKYGAPYGKVDLGTYKRTLFSLRPSFGSGENFQLGFSYLHGIDDINSIDFGAKPQENLVIGSDMMLAFDNKNILFTSQAAVSLSNEDISTGTLTNAQIDSIFGPNSALNIDPADVKSLRDIAQNFITVNQFLGPWNPQEFASLAAEAALSFNYFNNNLRASYIYRGNAFESYGQSFIRTDVRGINVSDRIRMIDNKVFLSVGYERLQDNLQKTKVATTTFQTINASLSIFPRANFPNITLGFNQFSNDNGLDVKNSIVGQYAVNDVTQRYSIQMSYDLDAFVKHNTTLSFSTSNREDDGYANSDAKFNALSFNMNSYWTRDLTSIFGIVYSSSDIANLPYKYVSLNLGGKYYMLENKLMMSFTFSPSFGDFERQALDFIADYNIISNLNLAFQARVYRFPGKSTNSIIGLVTRFTI